MLHNIGIAYYKLKDYRKGLTYFLKSLFVGDRIANHPSYFYTNIGLCYFYLNEFSKARRVVVKSLKDCGSDCPGKLKVNIEYALDLISNAEGNTDLAEKDYMVAYDLAKPSNV